MAGRNVLVAMHNYREALSAKYVLASICWGMALIRMENMLDVVACAFNPSTEGQADFSEFLGNWSYIMRNCLKQNKWKTTTKKWGWGVV